jgi:transcriptional regulator with XRE-family HTH domain
MRFRRRTRDQAARRLRVTVGVRKIKVPNPLDKHVGSRVRMRRMVLAMSQGKLGAALGVTFQQAQKYEKGTNRIGASRLQEISHVLQVPVGFFFEGASDASVLEKSNGDTRSAALLNDFVSSREGLRLVQSFTRIESAELQLESQELASHDRFKDG